MISSAFLSSWCSVFASSTEERGAACGGHDFRAPGQRRRGAGAARAENLVKAFYVVRSIASATTSRSATRPARRSSAGTSSATPCTGSRADWRSSASKKGDTVAIMLEQPLGVHPLRSGGRLARGGPVLDLPDVRSGADRVRALGRREQGGDHRAGLSSTGSTRRGRAASTLEQVIVVDGEGGDHTLDELMEMDPEFDPAESVESSSGPTTC